MGQDGKLYFGSNNSGIWYLDDDGLIKQTSKTDGSFICTGMGQDGKLYFAAGNSGNNASAGICYLDDDGKIERTNISDRFYTSAATGQDGKLYFTGAANVGVLRLSLHTGNAIAKTVTLKKIQQDTETVIMTESILKAFNSYLQITEFYYRTMSDYSINIRAQALIKYLAEDASVKEYTQKNEVIENNTVSCSL
jgi:hypothetical protein